MKTLKFIAELRKHLDALTRDGRDDRPLTMDTLSDLLREIQRDEISKKIIKYNTLIDNDDNQSGFSPKRHDLVAKVTKLENQKKQL